MVQATSVEPEIEGFRPPTRASSRATLARIAAATDALLAEPGPAGVTVADVVERANAPVGSSTPPGAGPSWPTRSRVRTPA